MEKFTRFARIAEIEHADIVLSTQNLDTKLRIYLKDKSFIDFFYTTRLKTPRFSLHWQKEHIDDTIYRLDNTPDKKWNHVKTFPLHFHNGIYNKVEDAPFNTNNEEKLEQTFRKFLKFVANNLKK